MTQRAARHSRLTQRLARLPDAELLSGRPLAAGIGGCTARLEVDGLPVFVKSVPLTDLERERPQWTGNVFDLPGCYQYGIGSTGFGVWRELAAHQRAHSWVVDGGCPNFPLLHHWRVIEGAPGPTADAAELLAPWDGDPRVRRRVDALATATATVTLALEWVAADLNSWLTAHPDRFDWADEQVHTALDFMAANGMTHFDVHPRNVLCDGERVYVTDFGLASDRSFDLDDREREFLDRHHDYDRRNAEWYLNAYAADGRYDQADREMGRFFDRLLSGPPSQVRWS